MSKSKPNPKTKTGTKAKLKDLPISAKKFSEKAERVKGGHVSAFTIT